MTTTSGADFLKILWVLVWLTHVPSKKKNVWIILWVCNSSNHTIHKSIIQLKWSLSTVILIVKPVNHRYYNHTNCRNALGNFSDEDCWSLMAFEAAVFFFFFSNIYWSDLFNLDRIGSRTPHRASVFLVNSTAITFSITTYLHLLLFTGQWLYRSLSECQLWRRVVWCYGLQSHLLSTLHHHYIIEDDDNIGKNRHLTINITYITFVFSSLFFRCFNLNDSFIYMDVKNPLLIFRTSFHVSNMEEDVPKFCSILFPWVFSTGFGGAAINTSAKNIVEA